MQNVIKSLSLVIFTCLLCRAQVNILSANGNNDRTNANLSESQLSPATVAVQSFGKIGAFAVDGQVYAQPLYASGISIPGKGVVNVVFVATMHNTVYAFDAGAPPSKALLWQVNLGTAVPSELLFGRYGDIGGEVGILGTGAIDLKRSVLYVASETLRNAVPAFHLHALDLATGAERLNGPVAITASVTGTGSGAANGAIAFNPRQHIQRPGLLVANNSVYVGFGSHADQSPWHGWLISYDASDLSNQAGVFVSTPSGNGGAFWQSGRGLAADSQGNVYAIAGNGDYDGVQNFSQSFLKLTGTAPVRTGSYTPPDWKSMSDNDFDLSAGPALISGTHTVIGADKMGYVYVLNGDAMGTASEPGAAGQHQYYFASQSSIFNFAVWSRPGGALVFVQGSRAPLTSFRVTGTELDTTPLAISPIYVQYARIGMTLSADGAGMDSGILWETSGNYNDAAAPGTLRAFRASDLTELWNTDMNPARDSMGPVAKFASPTVANGRVYVATFGNVVTVYGLLSAPPVSTEPKMAVIGSAASYEQETVSPGEMIAIFGSNLGPAAPAGMQLDENGSVTTVLAETRVLFDGVPGPMVYASPTQVNTIVPFGVSGESTQIVVEYQGQASAASSVAIAPSTPAIFSADGSGAGPAIAINQDGTINSPANPAPAGSVVVLYATGAGQLSPSAQDGAVVSAENLPRPVLPVLATVGDRDAEVLYAGGAPGFVQGIIQVNLKIAEGVAPGDLPVVLQIGERSSRQGITIAVQAAGQAPLRR